MQTPRDTNRKKRLVIVPSMKITVLPGEKLGLTKKFISGMHEYMRYWDGPTCVIGEPSTQSDSNLDHVEVSGRDPRSDLGFDVHLADFNPVAIRKYLQDGDVLLAGLEPDLTFLPRLRRLRNLTLVYNSEYSLQTRIQIAKTAGRGAVRLLGRSLRELRREYMMRRAVAISDGIQCNGWPTYEAYRGISRDPLLFFDTRFGGALLATEQDILRRRTQGPIRLVFSGRLIRMKGADHVVEVARHLATLGVDFELTLYGGGDLVPEMKRTIDSQGLAGRVKLAGVLDFNTELVPAVKERADLFVCCHRQGDPSCTYLETMSCGVPIIGYDNEAFRGIVRESNSGWVSPMDRPAEMASKIAQLSRNRDILVEHAMAALRFAQSHSFERTFEHRIEHLTRVAANHSKAAT